MDARHVVAVVGGATAGAETAGLFARRGATVVVFEQHARPYGKIEDGLPRWHTRLREREYAAIDAHLAHPAVHFVPLTRLGRDVALDELVQDWGFSGVILAHGAWRDRPLPVAGAEAWVGRGLVYQNAFIHWFNHCEEPDYNGPRWPVAAGTIVVGGGLASIDVCKVLQIEVVRAALADRGVATTVEDVERAGVADTLAAHGLTWPQLGLPPAVLFYRRRIEDMPVMEMPAEADAGRRRQVESVRRRLVEKASGKYGFVVRPLRSPADLLVGDGRLEGLRFQHTSVGDGQVRPVAGAFEEARGPLVISSIGSVPEPLPGIPREGELYAFEDPALGRLRGYANVFAVGNVVTGKGNIAVSRRHSVEVTTRLIEGFLGLGEGGTHAGEEELIGSVAGSAAAAAGEVADWVRGRPPLSPAHVARILERVRVRQRAVGCDGDYRAWMARHAVRSPGGA